MTVHLPARTSASPITRRSVYDLNGSQTYGGVINGTGSLSKAGSGVLTLSGTNNNYTGATLVNVGMLEVTNPGALSRYSTNLSVSVTSGATLALSVSGASGWTGTNIGSLITANSGSFLFRFGPRDRHHERQFYLWLWEQSHRWKHGLDGAGNEHLDPQWLQCLHGPDHHRCGTLVVTNTGLAQL